VEVLGPIDYYKNEKIIENNKSRVVFSGCNNRIIMTDIESCTIR
jgi:hypothetical protein